MRPFSLLLAVLLQAAPAAAANILSSVKGKVTVTKAGQAKALLAERGMTVAGGDHLRTEKASEFEITFEDGTKLSVGASSDFTLKAEAPVVETQLSIGSLRAIIKNVVPNRFKVVTPLAAAAVRGTDFRVTVGADGHTVFDLYSGLLGVGDLKGNERLLKPGERLGVDESGLGDVQQISRVLDQQQSEQQATARREVGLDMSKEQVLAAAAEEIKLAEYQQGKAIIDVFGNRVRLEQYILRPSPDQFKLVVLNERTDRFDYFYYLGTFNTNLPTDLGLALKDLSGKPLTAPAWYLTSYETGRSNTADTIQETASGGHPVDVNSNLDPDDNVTQYFDSTQDKYVSLSPGDGFYLTLFDNYAIDYNGLRTFAWAGTNIQSIKSVVKTYYGGVGNYIIDTDFPEFPILHQRIREAYGDGTVFVQYDNFIVSDDGSPAAVTDFAGVTTGPLYKQTLLQWNFQQVITSSLFGGRKIDLVVEPKTLIQSGLIP